MNTAMPERPDASAKMPIAGHLAELRRRLAIAALAVAVGTGLALYAAPQIYAWLQQPLTAALPPHAHFIALTPLEGWLVYFKIALFAGCVLASPVLLYQLWTFVSPGLSRRERRATAAIGLISAALFAAGALLCYSLVIPHGLGYFVAVLDSSTITLMPQMAPYLSFIMRLLIAFGIAFQLPFAVVLVVRWGLMSLTQMRRARPYVIVGAFALAALITPPDVFTQVALAIPFIALFEVSLVVARLFVTRGT